MRHKREYFRITKFARRYDRETGSFTFKIAYETAVELTSRTLGVAEAFGLGVDTAQRFVVCDNVELKVGPKDVVYVTGDSGSGKSVLLRAIKHDLKGEVADMTDIQPDPNKPIIETVGDSFNSALELASKAGLNDAFLFVRRFGELSDGQKYRYKIAKLMESDKQWWVCDEFCSVLDRDTAKIVAFNLQKIARQLGRAVVVATTHGDLFEDLKPSVHVHKRFGKEISVKYYANEEAKECSLAREMRIEEGCFADYKRLSGFHYRSGRCPPPRKIFVLKRGGEVCGVIVYSFASPLTFGRSKVWKGSFDVLQRDLSVISRVVVHPKYRSVGLGCRLVRETLPLAGTRFVELIAVMAKYNPFAEKAGMRRIAEQLPCRQALRVVEVLEGFGFSRDLLGCGNYLSDNFGRLSNEDVEEIKKAFVENCHPRFVKCFGSRSAFGDKESYAEEVEKASVEKLVKLIKVCGILMQTKVYLFWENPQNVGSVTKGGEKEC
jgi:ABC-type lipoprotein export system ATPase subunit